jgi:hypothetical protein
MEGCRRMCRGAVLPCRRDEPPGTGDERWDALLAALAEHLAAQHNLAPPDWAELRVLQRPWFPAELKVQRADALVRAPAAFRKHGVYLSAAACRASCSVTSCVPAGPASLSGSS